MTESAISVSGLYKSYGRIEALKDVDLHVAVGEVFAILGPNGAGKTTIIEILEGYRKPGRGSVSVFGRDPHSAGPAHRARTGILLQDSAVHRELTVAETLEMYAGYYPEPLTTDEALALTDLAARASIRSGRLSGGEKRRLDLALAIVGNPDLLFLDEPTTGFDPEARRRTWRMIRRMSDEGKTIVLTTHYMDEASSVADNIAILVGGKVVAYGPPASIGGRAVRQTRIWLSIPLAELPPLDADARSLADGRTLITTEDPTRVLKALADWATGTEADLDGVEVRRPSLEEIYLEIVAAHSPPGGSLPSEVGAAR